MPTLTDINNRPLVHYTKILAHEYDPEKHGRLFKAVTAISHPTRNYLKLQKDEVIAGPEEFFMVYEGAFVTIASPPKKKKNETEEPKITIVHIDEETFFDDEIRAIKMKDLKKKKKEMDTEAILLENKLLRDEVDTLNQKFFHLEDTVRIMKEKGSKKEKEAIEEEKSVNKKKERK